MGWYEPLRRRGYTVGLLIVAACVFTLTMLVGYGSEGEEIDGIWVAATVEGDGSFLVTEIIDYDFGNRNRRGIVRYVPDLSDDVPPTARSATAPDRLAVSELSFSDDTELRVGEPSIEISGAHRYELTFGIEQVREPPEVALNAVGDDWSVPVRNVEVHVLAETDLNEPWCSLAPPGRTVDCPIRTVAPGHLVVEVDEVENGHILTVGAETGESLGAIPATPAPPDFEGNGQSLRWWFAPVFGMLGALAAIPPITTLIRRLGREQLAEGTVGLGDDLGITRLHRSDIAAKAPLRYSPPEGLTASQGGVLVTEHVLDHHLTAWFLEAAASGELEIDHEEEPPVLRPGPSDPVGRLSARVHESLFSGRSEIKLSGHSPRVTSARSHVRSDLKSWREGPEQWSPDARRRRVLVGRVAWLLMVIAFVAAIALLILGVKLGALIAIAATVIAAAVIARAGELESLTPAATAQLIEVEGFRRYLAGDRPLDDGGSLDPGVLRRYTAWAVALGVGDDWAQKLTSHLDNQKRSGEGETAEKSGYRVHDEVAFATRAAGIGHTLTRVARPPSSSGGSSGSSGGFSGGSSGSGGGGGGGGSW